MCQVAAPKIGPRQNYPTRPGATSPRRVTRASREAPASGTLRPLRGPSGPPAVGVAVPNVLRTSPAAAVGHVLGAAAGPRESDRLRDVLGERHRWHAVRGHLHELSGDLRAAATASAAS